MKSLLKNSLWLRSVSVVAVFFVLMTVKEGGTVLFGEEAARTAAGAYVPWVLWFNFLAGFAYVAAGLGLWWRQGWAAGLALGIALATALVFAAFGVHVLNGGAYETRTHGGHGLAHHGVAGHRRPGLAHAARPYCLNRGFLCSTR